MRWTRLFRVLPCSVLTVKAWKSIAEDSTGESSAAREIAIF